MKARKEQGITLMALVVTIIVLLILAGISISMLTGDNGIIQKAQQAQIETEKATEKEQIQMSYLACKMEDYQNNVSQQAMQEELNQQVGMNKTKVTSSGENLIIEFTDTQRVYQIDQNGNITETEKPTIIDDEIGPDGEGTKDNPYKIMSIEDLYTFSIESNQESFEGQVIELGRDLDFLDDQSYIDANANFADTFGDLKYMGVPEGTVKEVLSTYFPPIAQNTEFSGIFYGNDHKIKNFSQNAVDLNLNNQGISTMAEAPYESALFKSNSGLIMNLEIENIKHKLFDSAGMELIAGICVDNNPSGSIVNCRVTGDLILNENIEKVSGIAITNMGVLYNCVNSMTLNYALEIPSGGTFSGICDFNAESYTGAIGKIINCRNDSKVMVENMDAYISGITNTNEGTIVGSYNTGNFTFKAESGNILCRMAGITITNEENGRIYASYNLGNLTDGNTEDIALFLADVTTISAGLAFENYGRIENGYNAGLLTGVKTDGIVYSNTSICANCYWQIGKSAGESGLEGEEGIYEMTEEEMKNKTFIDTLNNNLENIADEDVKSFIEMYEGKFVSNPQISQDYPIIEFLTVTKEMLFDTYL